MLEGFAAGLLIARARATLRLLEVFELALFCFCLFPLLRTTLTASQYNSEELTMLFQVVPHTGAHPDDIPFVDQVLVDVPLPQPQETAAFEFEGRCGIIRVASFKVSHLCALR